jgi:hypothetical protein
VPKLAELPKELAGARAISGTFASLCCMAGSDCYPARSAPDLDLVTTGLLTPVRFSLTTGHWKSSIATSARAADGRPVPWYTYPAIDFLAQRDFQHCRVLEFGGGQSTLWWSARARSVFTIEEDAGWLAKLQSQIGSNVSLHHVPVPASTRSLQPVRELLQANPIRAFDIIVVDGHLRQEATALAFEYLAPGGAIILDNAEGYGFFDEVSKRDCRRVDFFGFAPGVSLRHCTSIVFCVPAMSRD